VNSDIKPGDMWRVGSQWGLPCWLVDPGIGTPTRLYDETLVVIDVSDEFKLYNSNVVHVKYLTSSGIRFCYGNHIMECCDLVKRQSTWIPPRMPAPLLQELYWPDPWKVTVICIMLNCTQRKQVEPMIDDFFKRWPSAKDYIEAYEQEATRKVIVDMLRPLGFYNRRALRIYKFSGDLLSKGLDDIRKLYGVGEYAASCYEMLFLGLFGDTPPNDHALCDYWFFYQEYAKRDQE
jgi:endonuclease III